MFCPDKNGMLLLRAVLNILVRDASPRGPMSFSCLMFSLSETYEWCYFYFV